MSIRTILFKSFVVVALLAVGLRASAQSKSLTWSFGSMPCSEMLNCDEGCSACNTPIENDATFFGTGATWIGIGRCPHPIVSGDNAILTDGWELEAVDEKYVLFSGITLSAMQLDSVVVRHRSFSGGPTMLRISLKHEFNGTNTVVYEGPVTDDLTAVSLVDLGCAEVPEGMVMGGFQITLQPYGGTGGSWMLDELRVVAEPCTPDIITAIPGLSDTYRRTAKGQLFDLLGRPVPQGSTSGFRIDPVRRVIVY